MDGLRGFSLAIILVVLTHSALAVPETAPAMPPAGHSAHGESYNEGPRNAAYLMGGTGDVHFPVTCKSELAQEFFDQGVGQLHGFWYFEAERSFRQVAAMEPDCVMAYWGMAMANTNNKQRAREFIKEAVKRKTSAKLTPVEIAWIGATEGYYNESQKRKEERSKNLINDLKEMSKKFPDDIEIKAFLAVTIFEDGAKDQYPAADKALDEIFAVAPHHPAHHYRIHLMDVRSPKDGVASAALCGGAAPGIAHMWHMPGHIYSDLNRYADAAWQQEASARVDHAYMIRDRVMPFQIFNYMHNNEWLCRDLLFVGRVHDAIDLATNMIELPRHPTRARGTFYGPARLIDALSQHQMWEQYLAECAGGNLSEDLDGDQLIRKLRYEGVAAAALKRSDILDRVVAKLKDERKKTLASATRVVDAPKAPKKNGKRSRPATRPAMTQSASTNTIVFTKRLPTTRSSSAMAPTTRPTTQPALKYDRASTDRLAAIDQALDHINAEKAMAAGDFTKAATLLTSAKARKEHIAFAYLAAKNFAKAEEFAKQAVADGKEQTYPLAAQVLVLHHAGKKAEAAKSFEALRKLSDAIDLTVEPYRTLTEFAPDYGYKTDYRISRKIPTDFGARPALDSLGPFRWHPSSAPDWTAPSGSGSPVSLTQFRGKPVIVLFYLGHGCAHCIRQIHAFATASKQFTAAGISLVAIGTDTPDSLAQTWTMGEGTEAVFPLASDATLEIFKKYHCYDDFEKMPLHGTFLIDAQGLIRWQDISYDPFLNTDFLLKESKRLLHQDARN